MNNYHTFLIRSDYVTQLAVHLAAGILALVLVSGMTAVSKETRLPKTPAATISLATTALPAPLLATNK